MRVFRCFAFVDLCGFTRMNDTLGDDEALSVLATFRGIVRGLSPEHATRVGKLLGDGCMFIGTEVTPIVETVLDLSEQMENANIALPLRIGVAAGKDELIQAVKAITTKKGRVSFHWLDTADHGYRPLKSSGRTVADINAEVGAAAAEWVLRLPA